MQAISTKAYRSRSYLYAQIGILLWRQARRTSTEDNNILSGYSFAALSITSVDVFGGWFKRGLSAKCTCPTEGFFSADGPSATVGDFCMDNSGDILSFSMASGDVAPADVTFVVGNSVDEVETASCSRKTLSKSSCV